MWLDVLDEIQKHGRLMAVTIVALLAMAALVGFLRYVGWKGPTDPMSAVERIVDSIIHGESKQSDTGLVNVDLRDANGDPIRLGSLVRIILHNGHGARYSLEDGVFACDSEVVRAGGRVTLKIQDLLQEAVVVKLDSKMQMLYVQSGLTQNEIERRINQGN